MAIFNQRLSEGHVPYLHVRILSGRHQSLTVEPRESRDLTLRMRLCNTRTTHVSHYATFVRNVHMSTCLIAQHPLTFERDVLGWVAGVPHDDGRVQRAGCEVQRVGCPSETIDARHVKAPLELMCQLQRVDEEVINET